MVLQVIKIKQKHPNLRHLSSLNSARGWKNEDLSRKEHKYAQIKVNNIRKEVYK